MKTQLAVQTLVGLAAAGLLAAALGLWHAAGEDGSTPQRPATSVKDHVGKTKASSSLATAPVEVTYQGVTFRIPRNYLKQLTRETEKGGGFHIGVLADTFEPLTPETASVFREKWLYEGVTLFVNSYADRTAERGVTNRIAVFTNMRHLPSVAGGQIYGLNVYRALSEPNSQARNITRENKYVPVGAPVYDNETLEGEAIFCTSLISDSVKEGRQALDNLRCRHILLYDKFLLQLRYNKQQLPRWKDIRDGAIRLLDSFRISTPREGKVVNSL